jgi:hypothetical protein
MKSSMLMGDGLRRNAYKYPVKIAAQDRFRQVTYSELNARVNQLARLALMGAKATCCGHGGQSHRASEILSPREDRAWIPTRY